MGDLLYAFIGIVIIRYLIRYRKQIRKNFLAFLRDVVVALSITYFIFHLFWGFNYYRLPISQKLGLQETHTEEALVNFVEELIQKSNALHFNITQEQHAKGRHPFL